MRLMLFLGMFITTISATIEETMNQNGTYENDTYTYAYGSVQQETSDGVYLVYDEKDELMQTVIYDDLGHETFRYLADVNDGFLIVACERYFLSEDFEIPLFKDVLLILYDSEGNRVSYLSLPEKPLGYANHHHHLIVIDQDNQTHYYNQHLEEVVLPLFEATTTNYYEVQYQGQAYVNQNAVEHLQILGPGYYEISIQEGIHQVNYNITVEAEVIIEGEIHHGMYVGEVRVIAGGTLRLNQTAFESNDSIIIPGYYTLDVLGEGGYKKSVDFMILPEVRYYNGIESLPFTDHLEISQGIAIYSNAISMTLNQSLYRSEMIDQTGNYILTLYGANGMQIDLTFSIIPTVDGLEDGASYTEVSCYIFGEAILNGSKVTGAISIDTPGEYTLELMLDQVVLDSYHFTILPLEEMLETTEDQNPYLNYVFLGLSVVGGWIFLRKK